MPPAIEIEGLVKHYGDRVAVDGISLVVEAGEAFGYLGPNGAGKTTTIRCLLGLIRPTSGRIRVLGRDVGRDLGAALEGVGSLPGELGLWPQMTGAEVLDYLGRLHPRPPARRGELCERFELSRTDLERPVRLYSRGMKQKVGIVQAFQHDPPLAVLDEPTEGLDPVMKERFVELLAGHRAAGGTTFLSSHILPEVEQSTNRVAVVRAGRLVRVGPTDDLTGVRVRHCRLELDDDADPRPALAAAGATDLAGEGQVWRFDVHGPMGPVIRAVAGLGVRDFLAEPERLEEAFFDVYGGTGPTGEGRP